MEHGASHHVDSAGSSPTGILSKTLNVNQSTDEIHRPHRQRSLREIISGGGCFTTKASNNGKTRRQDSCLKTGSFMNVLLDDLDIDLLPRRSSDTTTRAMALRKIKTDPSLVFQKLQPTNKLRENQQWSQEEQQEIEAWMDNFKGSLMQKSVTKTEAERCINLLFQLHPELIDFRDLLLDQVSSLDLPESNKRRRTTPKRSTMNSTSDQIPAGQKQERERFFQMIEEWLDGVKNYIDDQPIESHLALWEKARLCFVYEDLVNVIEQLETLSCEDEINEETPERFTSGVSFVRQSESLQEGVSHIYSPLPPAIIQPPNLQIVQSNFVSESMKRVKTAEVLTVRMTNKDDAGVKKYLLEKDSRKQMVGSSPGSACYTIKGLDNISPLIGDRSFLCCHYYLEEGSVLQPCRNDGKGHKGIDQSNVQVGIIVRKGIGGTCTLKNSARSLNDLRILHLLLGTSSFPELNFSTDLCSSPCSTQKTLSTPTNFAKKESASSKVCKEVSVKSLQTPKKPGGLPPVVKSSLSDWFNGINHTANQIVSSLSERKLPPGQTTPCSLTESRDEEEEEAEQKAKKRRMSRCASTNNSLLKKVKLHTLSCRLEMFVEESLWKTLTHEKKNELYSIVIVMEEYLLEKIQVWNKERMFNYCRELISVIESNITDLERESPRLHNKHLLRNQFEKRKLNGMMELTPTPSKQRFPKSLAQVLDEQSDLNGSVEVFGNPPLIPEYCNSFSTHTLKATAVASGIHCPGLPDAPWPFYLIATRDCFTYDLIQVRRKVTSKGRTYMKTDFYFHAEAIPEDYELGTTTDHTLCKEIDMEESWEEVDGFPSFPPEGSVPVGVTTYSSLFSFEELDEIERMADKVHEQAQTGIYPPECFHPTIGRSGGLKRTKYFFGARYLWTKDQMSDPDCHVACGVRVDVPPNPAWMKQLVENPLVHGGIVPSGFINSWALNMYHDGSEGIQSHFDDSSRFCQPIYSLRLFSDSRLSFGTQLYGFTNGAFFVPMPRGCITIMHDKSYAANVVKHCVRPCDMTGKSAGLILRKINDKAWNEAVEYHMEETILWLSRLHIDEDYTPHPLGSLCGLGKEIKLGKGKGGNALDKVSIRTEIQIQSDVRSVMEGLLKGVTKTLNQEALNANKLKKIETKVIKQIMDQLIKVLEGIEKQQLRDRKQRIQEMSQVKNLMDTMIKKVEKNIYSPRKRKEQAVSYSLQKNKRLRSAGEMRPVSLNNKSVLAHATKIIERVMGRGNSELMQAACDLLEKFGDTWLRNVRGEDMMNFIEHEDEMNSDLTTENTPLESSRSRQSVEEADPNSCSSSAKSKEGLIGSEYPVSRPVTRSLMQGLSREMDGGMEDVCLDLEKTEEENEVAQVSKRILHGLLETVAKRVMPVDQEEREVRDGSNDHSKDLLRQFAQETDSLDLSASSNLSLTPSLKQESHKRTYKLVPWSLCFDCEKEGFDSPLDRCVEGSLWQCKGPCRRTFHSLCRTPASSTNLRCNECLTGTHKCHVCGEGANSELGSVLKCSLGVCGRYYHVSCVMAIPATTVLKGSWMPVGSVSGDKSCMKFRCPQHYCQTCGMSGANVFSVTCIRCPAAFHGRCRPAGCTQLSKKLILCPKHTPKA